MQNVVEVAADNTTTPDTATPDSTATDNTATPDTPADNTVTANTATTDTPADNTVAANTATPDTSADNTDTPAVGDCMEVLWQESWYACVIKQTQADPADGSPIWLCHYDHESKGIWHNLLLEQTRRVSPTPERIARLTSGAIRARLRSEGVRANTSMRLSLIHI